MKEIPDYSALALPQILSSLTKRSSALRPGEEIGFLILDPDHCPGYYAGEKILLDSREFVCRSWRSWNDLATQLGFRMLTPRPWDRQRLLLRFSKLNQTGFHQECYNKEKYGLQSQFSRITKEEEPSFLHSYTQALRRVNIAGRARILDLGIHRGDELEPIRRLAGDAFERIQIIGVDRCAEALEAARRRFSENLKTYRYDINALNELDLGRFDLILSIGTLQSPGIEMKPLIMYLVQNHLSPGGALLLGWPNSRWIDGELIYGAKAPHYPFSELSLVIKDLHWIKKYLQQHRFRVVITGREYLFLEATSIG